MCSREWNKTPRKKKFWDSKESWRAPVCHDVIANINNSNSNNNNSNANDTVNNTANNNVNKNSVKNTVKNADGNKPHRICKKSYGIICRRYKETEPEYLVIHRKYSIGFEELIRSHWELNQIDLIYKLCDDMSLPERNILKNTEPRDYYELWSKIVLNVDLKSHDKNNNNPTNNATTNDVINNNNMRLDPSIDETKYPIRTFSSRKSLNNNNSLNNSNVGNGSSSSSSGVVSYTTTHSIDDFIKANTKYKTLYSGYWYNSHTLKVELNDNSINVNVNSKSKDASHWNWITLNKIFDECKSFYDKPPLEFPKGKRSHRQEDEKKCAMREFEEETNVPASAYQILDHIPPLEEKFVGLNGHTYIYIYYLARMKPKFKSKPRSKLKTKDVADDDNANNNDDDALYLDPNNKNQVNEISEIKWATESEILAGIRPKCIKRLEVFTRANKLLEQV